MGRLIPAVEHARKAGAILPTKAPSEPPRRGQGHEPVQGERVYEFIHDKEDSANEDDEANDGAAEILPLAPTGGHPARPAPHPPLSPPFVLSVRPRR